MTKKEMIRQTNIVLGSILVVELIIITGIVVAFVLGGM